MLAVRTLLILGVAVSVSGQSPQRRAAANIGGLLTFPAFYHGRQIVVIGDLTTEPTGHMRVSNGVASLRVVFSGSAPDGSSEIRGEFWDLARMNPDDTRLTRIDLQKTFGLEPGGPWPRGGEVIAIMASAVAPAAVPPAASIRTIVLNPARYLNQKVTVTGQFTGRNLRGDLPDAPARSRWDFVIRSADAAMWVSGARPKGKGFDLALDARIDTSRWLDVSGVVREGRGLQWLEVASEGLQLAKTPGETQVVEEGPTVHVPAAPPPEVVFSTPTEGEADVSLTTSVRIQFSRDIAPATLRGKIRVGYLESETRERGEPTTPTAEFTTQYLAPNRVLELKFTKPLERFRTLKIDLQEGILGTDQQPMKPFTLTFLLGGA
jgi:Bacterial Ig-like domain